MELSPDLSEVDNIDLELADLSAVASANAEAMDEFELSVDESTKVLSSRDATKSDAQLPLTFDNVLVLLKNGTARLYMFIFISVYMLEYLILVGFAERIGKQEHNCQSVREVGRDASHASWLLHHYAAVADAHFFTLAW